MARINDIVESVEQNFPGADLALLQKAYVYSAKVHQGQTRLSGEPYLSHPLEVAHILADMRLDGVTVAAGLLHDAVEDTLATEEEIQEQFGEEMAFLVSGLTKLSKIEFQSRQEHQAESFRKMLLAMSRDIRIILIKLADRLHNMRTVEHMTDEARRRISQETLDIYAPLAHRLGIYWMKQELEERAFRQLHSELCAELEKHIRGTKRERERYIELVRTRLSELLQSHEIRAEVTGRLKELYSLYQKMRQEQLEPDEVYDLIAFRVIVDGTPATCYETLGIVHGLWKPVPGRFKDYIAMPKENGYQSLHTTVIGPFGERMEVQIRTQEQHRVAELGIAAHWKYKQGEPRRDSDEQQFAWLRQLLEWQQHLKDPNEFLETVRVDLFPDEVYVFTPRGDVISLPSGATPVDFAYAVHSEIGNRCAGAKVNGQLVPLRHSLSNGDTVEILTSPHQRPRREWLEGVVTGRARSRIRHFLRQVEVEQARNLGKQILQRDLQRRGRSYDKLLKAGEVRRVAKELNFKGIEALLQAVAYGRLAGRQIVRRLVGDEEKPAEQPALLRRVFRPRREASGVKVGGMGNVLVRFARCCSPVPGDPVDGFITRGRGVTVHARDCPRIFHLDPERRVPVEWEGEGETRPVSVKVVSEDRPGILAAISKQISAEGVNIRGARIFQTGENRAAQTFDLAVQDRRHLDAVMRKLSRIRGVLSVERVRS
jgi:guanosine-3',5'-bis(diphosphate) 3'-pyrophosphohydrolase